MKITRTLMSCTLGMCIGCAAATPEDPTGTSQAALATSPYTFDLAYRGGGGGALSTTTCGGDNVVIGLYARTGDYVDQLGLVCAPLRFDGSIGPAFTSAATGGYGGVPQAAQICPANQFVVAVEGAAGAYLNYFKFYCGTTWLGLKDAYPQRVLQVGGGPGGDSFTDACPLGYAITGFNFRAGSWIDGEQPICDYIAPSAIARGAGAL